MDGSFDRTAFLFSIEPWDDVWRRNQQLASRMPGTVFVEPPSPGITSRTRRVAGIPVITTAKPVPLRWPGGRALQARLALRKLSGAADGAACVLWVTHPDHLEIAASGRGPVVYDRTDDWPAMELVPASAAEARRRESELFRHCAHVVIVSERMRPQVPDGIAVSLIPNGVDTASFRPAKSRPPGTPLKVGFAGTLDPFRVDYELIEELAARTDVEVTVAGPGEPPRGVTAVGILPHNRVPEFLAPCDVLLAPYRAIEANQTADGLKLYEYFATGKPVLATMTAGFERYPELIIRWPCPDLGAAVAKQTSRAEERVDVAARADWSRRAEAMAQVLRTVGR